MKLCCPSHVRILQFSVTADDELRTAQLDSYCSTSSRPSTPARFAGPGAYLAVGGSVDPVVVDPPLVAQGDGSLPGAALALPHQEAAVDAAAQQVLGRVPRHRPVVPRVLLQAVHRRDVIAGDPALPVLGLCLAPLPIVVVAQHTELFALGRRKCI